MPESVGAGRTQIEHNESAFTAAQPPGSLSRRYRGVWPQGRQMGTHPTRSQFLCLLKFVMIDLGRWPGMGFPPGMA